LSGAQFRVIGYWVFVIGKNVFLNSISIILI